MTDGVAGQLEPDAEPAFAEPWQAQAFALTMQLSKRGAFTWGEWVEVFSAEIRTRPAQAGEDSTDAYYRQWLAALETILTARGLSDAAEITGVQELWRQAYINTPHGMPIALENAGLGCGEAGDHGGDPDHDHGHEGHGHHQDHDHHRDDHAHHHHVVAVREPVAVSPAVPRA